MTPETLDALLELWATVKLRDGVEFRRLWYPTATPEEKFARRGGASPSYSTDPGGDPDAFLKVDKAIAALKSKSYPNYAALHQRYLETGPDESRAKRLRVPLRAFQWRLDAARRWLRDHLDE